jgi:predicted nuclease of predicted toxin-antitoxin system
VSRVYFTDRDLGKRFPEILAAAGLTVERHHDLFPPDGSDEQWLEHCGRNGRIAITHNERIRYTPNELAAVVQHRVALLVVVGKVPLAELAQNFVNTLPKIEAFLEEHQSPYIAKVYRPPASEFARAPLAQGSISLWYPK